MPTIKTGIRFSKKQPLSEQELRQLHAYWRRRTADRTVRKVKNHHL